MSEITNISSQGEFEEKIKKGVVLVDIWATWCGPCKVVLPILEQINQESSDKVTILKVDADANRAIAFDLGVRSIPTMIFYKDGIEIKRLIGAKSKVEIMGVVDSLN